MVTVWLEWKQADTVLATTKCGQANKIKESNDNKILYGKNHKICVRQKPQERFPMLFIAIDRKIIHKRIMKLFRFVLFFFFFFFSLTFYFTKEYINFVIVFVIPKSLNSRL